MPKHPALKRLSEFLVAALNLLFTALFVGLLFVAIFEKEWVKQAISTVAAAIEGLGNWNYLIAFASAVVESFPAVGVLVPGMQVMLLVGGFFGKAHLGEMIAVAAMGAILGNALGYFLGIRYGKAFFRNYGDVFGLGRTELRYLERQIEKNGPWFVIFGKFHNFTRAFVPFIAGSAGMHPKKFWMYNLLGSAIWASTIITLGVVFAKYYATVTDFVGYVFVGILALFAAYVAAFRRDDVRRYLEEKQKEFEERERERSSKT